LSHTSAGTAWAPSPSYMLPGFFAVLRSAVDIVLFFTIQLVGRRLKFEV